ncbi:MAG: hypothetical protein JXQ75_17770 [Phycisphaerae bacterium]|nr:hypothetical protein [Phycisphaerae bacterium]
MKNLKVAIVVVALAAAAVIAWHYGSGDRDIPDDEGTKTLWMCSECKHVFEMTAREVSEARDRGPKPWPPAICPACGEQKSYLAQKCPQCGTVYFGSEVEGGTGACPKCHPEVEPPELYYPEEETEDAPIRRPRPRAI